jgi:hypothetical protein
MTSLYSGLWRNSCHLAAHLRHHAPDARTSVKKETQSGAKETKHRDEQDPVYISTYHIYINYTHIRTIPEAVIIYIHMNLPHTHIYTLFIHIYTIPEAVILLLHFCQPHAQPPPLRDLSEILTSQCPIIVYLFTIESHYTQYF